MQIKALWHFLKYLYSIQFSAFSNTKCRHFLFFLNKENMIFLDFLNDWKDIKYTIKLTFYLMEEVSLSTILRIPLKFVIIFFFLNWWFRNWNHNSYFLLEKSNNILFQVGLSNSNQIFLLLTKYYTLLTYFIIFYQYICEIFIFFIIKLNLSNKVM